MSDRSIVFDAIVSDDVMSSGCVAVVGVRGAVQLPCLSVYPVRAIMEDIAGTCDGLMELALQSGRFSVVVNSRVLDPAFVQGHNHFGGLSTRELFYFMERLKLLRNWSGGSVVGFDDDPELKMKLLELLRV